MPATLLRTFVCALLLVVGWATSQSARAEDVKPPAPSSGHLSGYDRVPRLGGPDSTHSALRRHDQKKDATFRLHVAQDALAPYYRFKKRLKDRAGLSFGIDYNVLYQVASAGLTEDEAAGGALRFYGNWILLGRGTPNTGSFVFRVENRHRLGTAIAPARLGPAIGSLFNTTAGFSDWEWGVTNLQWQQWWCDGRYGVAVGQVDFRDWVDVFDLSNWRTALGSQAVTYPTNPLPSAGLGGAVFACFRKRSTPYVLAGVSDANGHADEFGFDTFFHTREYYSFVELGWTPSIDRRLEDHVRLTYWHQDARAEASTPEGWGLSFSASWKFNKRWAPFLRGGIAEGGLIRSKAAIAGGLGLHRRSHDLVGVALGWGTPWQDGLRDQTTLEAFYRLQLSQNLGITPDVQVLFRPSMNPSEDVIGVFGLRAQFVL